MTKKPFESNYKSNCVFAHKCTYVGNNNIYAYKCLIDSGTYTY